MTVRLPLLLGLALSLLMVVALSGCQLSDLPWKNADGSPRSFLPPADLVAYDEDGGKVEVWCGRSCFTLSTP